MLLCSVISLSTAAFQHETSAFPFKYSDGEWNRHQWRPNVTLIDAAGGQTAGIELQLRKSVRGIESSPPKIQFVGWSLFSLPPLSLEVFSCYEPSHVKFQTGSETRHFPHRPWWWWLSVSRPRHRKTMTSASEGRTCRSGSKGQRCHIRWCHDVDARGGPSEPVTHEIRGARRLVIRSAQPPSEVARNGNLCEHGSANQACCWRRPDPSSGWLREEIST